MEWDWVCINILMEYWFTISWKHCNYMYWLMQMCHSWFVQLHKYLLKTFRTKAYCFLLHKSWFVYTQFITMYPKNFYSSTVIFGIHTNIKHVSNRFPPLILVNSGDHCAPMHPWFMNGWFKTRINLVEISSNALCHYWISSFTFHLFCFLFILFIL